ncbi:MAG: hypothetical protein HN576_07760 [Bacteriovoracaceae bacterium]|jgi:hypothetical protein|nr:hypothetical protein [Bacteriovoracaceae bacterium]
MFKKILYGVFIVTSLLASEAIDEEIIKDLEFFTDMEMVEEEFVELSKEIDSKLLTAEMETEQ